MERYKINDKLAKAAERGDKEEAIACLRDGADPKEHNPLLKAAKNGHGDVVELLLSNGADPNKHDFFGVTALELAARNGYIDVTKLLLSNGADQNKDIALSVAAVYGHREIVEVLLSHGADPNSGSALSEAAMYGHREIVELLLSHGADPNSCDALELAAGEGHTDIVKRLLNHGSDPNKSIALSVAATYGHIEIVEVLLSHGADPNSRYALQRAVRKGHTNIVKLLLSHGSDPNNGRALSNAAERGHREIVELLLSKGADPNSGNALSEAAEYGRREIVELLLSHGADPNSGSALSEAARYGRREIVELLLSHGADPNSDFPLSYAVRYGHREIYELLLSHGADLKSHAPLVKAAANNHGDVVELLLSNGADPNKQYFLGYTALTQAAIDGHTYITKLLLSNGADPNKHDFFGDTALKKAAIYGHTDFIKLLLSNGADPDQTNALDCAVREGHTDIVKLLLSHVSDPNNGIALSEAAKYGHREIVELLLNKGADPNSGDPLKAAVMSQNIDILRLLLDKGADIKSSYALEMAVNNDLNDIVSLLLINGADPKKVHSKHVYDYHSVKNKLAREKQQIQHHQKEYTEGIREAVEKPCNITVTVVGHKGVGKSCLVKQLKQESIPKGGPGSTDTADFYVNYLAFNPKTGFRQKLDVDGEINTARRRLRMIVDQHQKHDTTDDGEPESVQHFSNIPYRHLIMNKSEPHLAHQDTDTTELSTKGKMAVAGNPDREAENRYNGKSQQSPPLSTAPHLSLTTKEQITGKIQGFGRTMKQILSRVMFRRRPKFNTVQSELVHEIMRTETPDGEKEVKGFVTIYDFGGEKVFYNTIHCFLSSNMVFVIVIDVEMCLDPEKSAAGYEITGQWLKNVATYAVEDAGNDVRTPPILLVGSHLDKLSADAAEQEKKFKTVLDKLNADPHLREIMDNHVLGVFAIANLNDSTKNKELYEYIWQTVLRIAPLQSQWMKPVPARWVALQHELVRLKHAGVTVMMYEDLVDTNSSLPVPLQEEEIKPFLLNLKLNGSFHCFGLEGKNPFLVLRAQWTIDAFKAVITDPKFTASLPHMLSHKWKQYEKSGVLRLELLLELWAEEIFFEKREILCIVMETLNLLAKPVLDDPDADVDYYIVPSMLRNADLEVIQPILDAPDTITTVTLCLKFNNPFIPQAVWDKMIASCIHRFGSLHVPAHEELTFIWRGFACLAVDSVWNVIIHCKDNAMKVTMFKNAKEDTPQERVGAGVNVLCILEFLLQRILESNHQKHLGYQFYFHKDYRITSSDKMVKKDDLQKNTSAKCHGLKGEHWIDRDEIYTWFKHPNSEKLEVTSNLGELMARLPKRKLTYREVNRVSRFIGNGFRPFFVELDLPIATLEQEMEEHRHLAFRSRITKLFIQRMKLKAGMDFATVADAMSRNGMDPTKLTSVIDENRESVFVDDRLPVPWLQKPLSVTDVPVIERYLDVKAYFSLFLELGFPPKKVDDFDDQYRHKATSEKIKALLKAFITESKPRPTRNAILLAMRECNMDTESLITALKNT